MTTNPGDQLDPTQPFSLSDLFDDDDEGVSLDVTAENDEQSPVPPPPGERPQ
jgi:hypothetical protein